MSIDFDFATWDNEETLDATKIQAEFAKITGAFPATREILSDDQALFCVSVFVESVVASGTKTRRLSLRGLPSGLFATLIGVSASFEGPASEGAASIMVQKAAADMLSAPLTPAKGAEDTDVGPFSPSTVNSSDAVTVVVTETGGSLAIEEVSVHTFWKAQIRA